MLKGCQVCTGSGRQRNCSWSVLLKDPAPTTLEFTCSAPQDHFSVEVTRNIGTVCSLVQGCWARFGLLWCYANGVSSQNAA